MIPKNANKGASGFSGPAERQREAEQRLKNLLKGLGKLPEAAPAPEALVESSPRMMTETDLRLIWQLSEDVKALKTRYEMIVKVVWRTSAAVLGLAAPVFGWDFINKILQALGG